MGPIRELFVAAVTAIDVTEVLGFGYDRGARLRIDSRFVRTAATNSFLLGLFLLAFYQQVPSENYLLLQLRRSTNKYRFDELCTVSIFQKNAR